MNSETKFQLCVSVGLSLSLVGCAGPNTPVGAIWDLSPSSVIGEFTRRADDVFPQIQLYPSKQVLHASTPLKVAILDDPRSALDTRRFTIRYNGYDVTRSFLLQSKVRRIASDGRWMIEAPSVRLPADDEHRIEFQYSNSAGQEAYTRYESPVCYAFRPRSPQHTGDFHPPEEMLKLITNYSQKHGVSPAFLTGLIAQESRFEPDSVSWAKAIGLTQITDVAEMEVIRSRNHWPRYPGLNRMNAHVVHFLIATGKVNEANEWRLAPETSIEGGLIYVKSLAERWSSDANKERLKHIFKDPELAQTQLVLASYHSGYSRVSSALDKLGKDWLKSSELKEARKYVNRISSYCYHFSESEDWT